MLWCRLATRHRRGLAELELNLGLIVGGRTILPARFSTRIHVQLGFILFLALPSSWNDEHL